jgi:serine/threonine protein kinase
LSLGQTFNVTKRYEYIKVIGQGAYGIVISAFDKLKNRNVAIKKVHNAFVDLIDAKRIIREIKLLGKQVMQRDLTMKTSYHCLISSNLKAKQALRISILSLI